MEILEVFLLSIAIGVVVHLLVRWSERCKSRAADDTSKPREQSSADTPLGSALGEVERELRDSLSGERSHGTCTDERGASCAGCTTDCTALDREHKPRVVYYDDEELDVLAHRPIESYTEEELEMLREVAETLLESDYEGWLRSLSVRGILLPPEILRTVTH